MKWEYKRKKSVAVVLTSLGQKLESTQYLETPQKNTLHDITSLK